jgi:hypothetical protein
VFIFVMIVRTSLRRRRWSLMSACSIVIHRCCECKREFQGGWAEWFCPECKESRQRLFARDWAKRQKEQEANV